MNDNVIDFLVLSFPKSGTSSLDKTFRQHPEICLPIRKETWFFDDENFKKGLSWYKEQFPRDSSNKDCRGEITTTVLLQNNFIKKLKKVIPNGKLIVLLRDPIKRCLSHYYHNIREGAGIEDLPLEDALTKEKERLLSGKRPFSWYAYAGIGLKYILSVQELLAAYPREQIKFVLFEELIENPEAVISDMYEFIGVSPLRHSLARENTARMPGNRFLEKILKLPSKFLFLYPSSFMRRIIPEFIERKFRVIRHKIHNTVSNLPEMSHKEFKIPDLPPKLAKNLADKYNKELRGLDRFMNKPLSNYWKWYKP